MKSRRGDRLGLEEAAREWACLLPAASISQREACVAWLRQSPDHVRAFLMHLALEKELGQIDGQEFDVDRLLLKASKSVVPLQGWQGAGGPVESRARVVPWRILTAAALLLSCGAGWFALQHGRIGTSDYITQVGEQLRIPLPDGTLVELNTQSHVSVTYSDKVREIVLVSGEAMFSVKHDASRPFRVHVDHAIIEDLGTQFSVYRHADATTALSVLEGKVTVSSDAGGAPQLDQSNNPTARVVAQPLHIPTMVDAGQNVSINARGTYLTREETGSNHVGAWRSHQVWFDHATLAEVAAEFNRYNTRKLFLGQGVDAILKKYSGTFDAYDPDSFVQFILADPLFRVETDKAQVRIEVRK